MYFFNFCTTNFTQYNEYIQLNMAYLSSCVSQAWDSGAMILLCLQKTFSWSCCIIHVRSFFSLAPSIFLLLLYNIYFLSSIFFYFKIIIIKNGQQPFFFFFFWEEIAYHLIREFYTTKSLSIVMSPLNVNKEENSPIKKKKKKRKKNSPNMV